MHRVRATRATRNPIDTRNGHGFLTGGDIRDKTILLKGALCSPESSVGKPKIHRNSYRAMTN